MALGDYRVTTEDGSVVVIREKDDSDGCGCGTIVSIALLLYIISLLGGC